MAKRRKKKKKNSKKEESYLNIITGIVLVLLSIFGLLCNYTGPFGKLVASFSMFLMGSFSIVLLVSLLILGIYLVVKNDYPNFLKSNLVGFYLIIIGIMLINNSTYFKESINSEVLNNAFIGLSSNVRNSINSINLVSSPGIIGLLLTFGVVKLLSIVGTYILSFVFLLIGIIFATGFSISKSFNNIFSNTKLDYPEKDDSKDKEDNNSPVEEKEPKKSFFDKFFVDDDKAIEEIEEKKIKEEREKPVDKTDYTITSYDELLNAVKKDTPVEVEAVEKPKQEDGSFKASITIEDLENNEIKEHKNYILPSVNLLTRIDSSKTNNSNENIEDNIKKLETVLADFQISGKVVAYTKGPAVTQYEVKIKSGTKVSKILSISREISLALAKKDVRIEAPIPGKDTVGIELPNNSIATVGFREVFEECPSNMKNSPLAVVLGRNIMGKSIWFELNKAPHLLVAGATGSGKSVCINGIIASILMRTKPSEVKLVLVDPKKVEFSMYFDIPHLLMPVVNEPKKAAAALQKLVAEMDKRYDIFAKYGVKNITGYNEMIDEKNKSLDDNLKEPHMYYIVCIIDELADLMVVASKEVEDSIMRITQMARAAGIHLIVATQRPSTDVITGVVKANIPSRISFAVSSSIDSRTILDMTGAEKLLGRGDMLFLPMGENSPQRVQGSFIEDGDIEKIASYTKKQSDVNYSDEFMNLTVKETSGSFDGEGGDNDDPLYDEVVKYAQQQGTISSSKVQRTFNVGFNRAAKIIDLLEERGIVGPATGNGKPREVLVKNPSVYDETDD